MAKTIIVGVAALLLSAGVAVAQSNSDQSSMSAGTSAKADAQSSSTADTASMAKPAKKMRGATHYPKAEAKLNSEEAQVTKQLNEQQAQVAANGSTQQ